MGENVLVEFEKFFNWGIFFKVGGKKLFWDRENQLLWELYGPLSYIHFSSLTVQFLMAHAVATCKGSFKINYSENQKTLE